MTKVENMMVELKNVDYSISGRDAPILSDISLTVGQGEFVCILGPSGCGKSTLLYAIAGFNKPTNGQIRTGHGLQEAGTDTIMVFQDANAALFPWMTVSQNIDYGLRRNGRPNLEGAESNACRREELLTLVRLNGHEDKYPHQLSGGMKQRLQLARVLSVKRPILLMDEPLAALDALSKVQLEREIREMSLGKGTTVIYVTHDVQEAALLADRVLVMSRGPASRIAHDIPSQVTNRQIGDPKVAEYAGELYRLVTEQ
ncbi:Nitrate import ATP-binding protein NrtD [Castellaniella defragrans]